MTSSSTGRRGIATATHYQVLGLEASLVAAAEAQAQAQAQDAAAQLVKRAYRRALLLHHPDKTSISTSTTSTTTSSTSSSTRYTVDQISQAYAVLADPQKRHAYDATQRTLRRRVDSENNNNNNNNNTEKEDADAANFQTGFDVVDLDDLAFDPRAQTWSRSCRCGNPHGFALRHHHLLDASDDGVLMVACHDCSLWIKVQFAVVDQG